MEHSCSCKETDCPLSTCEKMRRVVNHYRWMQLNKKYDIFMFTQFLPTTGYASRKRWAPVTFASSCSRSAATTPSSARPPSARCPSATASASTCRGGGSRRMQACKEGWRRWGFRQKMLSTPSAMYLMSVIGKSGPMHTSRWAIILWEWKTPHSRTEARGSNFKQAEGGIREARLKIINMAVVTPR